MTIVLRMATVTAPAFCLLRLMEGLGVACFFCMIGISWIFRSDDVIRYSAFLVMAMTFSGLIMLAPAAAIDLRVRYGDVIEPDAELSAFLTELRANIARGEKGVRAVEKSFAPEVRTFQRGREPMERWIATQTISRDFLASIAEIIVERAEMVDANGDPVPEDADYSPEALKLIGEMIAPGAPLGTMKEMPGAICSPAAWSFDKNAAAAFLKQHKSTSLSLIFFDHEVEFLARPAKGADVKSIVPAFTLMLWEFEKDLPMEWNHYYALGGADGYMQNRDDSLGLSQMHVCFSKIGGKYGISGIFGYGL